MTLKVPIELTTDIKSWAPTSQDRILSHGEYIVGGEAETAIALAKTTDDAEVVVSFNVPCSCWQEISSAKSEIARVHTLPDMVDKRAKRFYDLTRVNKTNERNPISVKIFWAKKFVFWTFVVFILYGILTGDLWDVIT
jgi:hypothetical protein